MFLSNISNVVLLSIVLLRMHLIAKNKKLILNLLKFSTNFNFGAGK